MVKWLTSAILLLALASGVVAGTLLHISGMGGGMMGCCDKAKSNEQSSEANAARLCCAINCTSSTPTSSVGTFNFAPSNIEISKSVAEQISELFQKEKAEPRISPRYSRQILPRIFQPKYIQNSSFLI